MARCVISHTGSINAQTVLLSLGSVKFCNRTDVRKREALYGMHAGPGEFSVSKQSELVGRPNRG